MVELINLIFTIFYLALLTRIILSFLPMLGVRPNRFILTIYGVALQITEPVLAPIRRVLPSFGMLDFSPMVVMIIMFIIQRALNG